MIWFILALGIALLIAAISSYIAWHAIKQNLILADQREELVDTIEESLDELDECYTAIATKAQIDVLSDEPIIRELINDIKRARNAMLSIASKVVVYGEQKDEKDE